VLAGLSYDTDESGRVEFWDGATGAKLCQRNVSSGSAAFYLGSAFRIVNGSLAVYASTTGPVVGVCDLSQVGGV
jgi:hypothetical protein